MGCQKRLTFKTLLLRFGDGKHRFYLESVCGLPTLEGMALCEHCRNIQSQTKTQDVGTFPHGLVSGPYTKESHIYDSPWYLAKVGTYGIPSSIDVELAKMAQTKARAGQKTKTLESLRANDNSGSAGVATACIPSTSSGVLPLQNILGNNSNSSTSETAAPTNHVGKEKKKRAPAASKKKALPPPNQDLQSSLLTQLGAVHETVITSLPAEGMAETMDTPLEVKRVVRIVLRLFTHNDTVYWRDSTLEKVYKRKPDGSLGVYVGRYDSEQDRIVTDAPDSDQE